MARRDVKVAYLHVLPLEYYPPARNVLTLMSRREGWKVRAWSSPNRRGLPEWNDSGVQVSRRADASPRSSLPLRIAAFLGWHARTAAQIARWKPDALISVEPHSALAAWMYYHVFRGRAALFIHHHEYYSAIDFLGPGMRTLRSTANLERNDLFRRARWVSETNAERMRLLREWTPQIADKAAYLLPNYPPAEWIGRATRSGRTDQHGRIRLVYVGSASFEDTYIREAATWVAAHPDQLSLHVVSDNIRADVWDWLRSLASPNITLDSSGCDYDALPGLLTQFDVGLVLYKGNTLNFVYNVPNKAFEYLACGLDVWYPPEMKGMRIFHDNFPHQRLREVNFRDLPADLPKVTHSAEIPEEFQFTCEAALAPLFVQLEAAAHLSQR